jgi:hypothetical protein
MPCALAIHYDFDVLAWLMRRRSCPPGLVRRRTGTQTCNGERECPPITGINLVRNGRLAAQLPLSFLASVASRGGQGWGAGPTRSHSISPRTAKLRCRTSQSYLAPAQGLGRRLRLRTVNGRGRYMPRLALQSDGVAEVRVAFIKVDGVELTTARSRVPEDIEPIADVDHIDQSVFDDGVAPHHNLVQSLA